MSSAIADGATVSLFGLLTNEYNSQEGICHGVHENGRYIIELASKKRILVKRENIKVVPRSQHGPLYTYTHDHDLVNQSLAATPPNSSWANGLSEMAAWEWFVDCYRMRLDDEYAWQGDVRSGSLYDPEHSAHSIAADFLVYCLMAKFTSAVPDKWNWTECLEGYGHLLNYGFVSTVLFQ